MSRREMVAAGTTVSRRAERAGFWIYLEARASRICKCPKCGKRRKRTPMACRCRATVMAREQPRGTSRKPGLNGVCRLMLYNTKACLHVSLCAQPSLRSEPLRPPLLGALPLPSPEAATTPTSATTRLDITPDKLAHLHGASLVLRVVGETTSHRHYAPSHWASGELSLILTAV